MAAINTDQVVDVILAITNAAGNPATVDGVPVWASSDETVIVAAAAADGMSAVITTVAPGTARVTVTADADLGAGVTTLTGVTEDLVVTLGPSSQASVMTLTLGAPRDK
jgi:hypothetical protein